MFNVDIDMCLLIPESYPFGYTIADSHRVEIVVFANFWNNVWADMTVYV